MSRADRECHAAGRLISLFIIHHKRHAYLHANQSPFHRLIVDAVNGISCRPGCARTETTNCAHNSPKAAIPSPGLYRWGLRQFPSRRLFFTTTVAVFPGKSPIMPVNRMDVNPAPWPCWRRFLRRAASTLRSGQVLLAFSLALDNATAASGFVHGDARATNPRCAVRLRYSRVPYRGDYSPRSGAYQAPPSPYSSTPQRLLLL